MSTVLLGALVVADARGPLRIAMALWFLLVCTGMSFAPLFDVACPRTRLVLGVALSLAIDAVVATVLLLTGTASATSGLLTLAALCLVGCSAQVRLSVHRARAVTIRHHG